jgi:hypothetical protein
MTHQSNSKGRPYRSQQTIHNLTISFPEHHIRQSKPVKRIDRVSVQRIHVQSRAPQRHLDEFIVFDKEKEAVTGRWVLGVIATNEAYQQARKTNKNYYQPKTKQSANVK